MTPDASATPPKGTGYAPQLGLFSATMLVVGGIIGAGIFLNPAIVAQRVGTGPATMATWGLGALIAIVGAFVFAELGARAPRAGGGYVYLRDAFGAFPAFLYGWALFLMISTGAIAAVAMTCASYATSLFALDGALVTPIAVGAIVLLTVVNIVGVRPGAITQNVATVLKLSAIAFLIAAAFLAPPARAVLPAGAAPLVVPTSPADGSCPSARHWSRCCLRSAAGSRRTSSPRSCAIQPVICHAHWCSACWSSWRRICW